jgi:2-furoyl-CoA dehydrogenase FAD binding subunit
VHADAAAEMPVVLALRGGAGSVCAVRGSRTIPAAELFAGPLESSLAGDEIATEAFFPALRPGEGVGFAEIARRHGDYALVGVAGLVRVDGDDVVEARLGFLSVNDVPTVVDVSGLTPQNAAEHVLTELEPADDIHATAAYRTQLVRVLTRKVLEAATTDARGRAA